MTVRQPKAYVLDSWAIMALLEDEPSAKTVADLLSDAHENGIPLLMTTVNAGEVWYVIARTVSTSEADKIMKHLEELGIRLVDATWDLALQAAQFKSRHRMSYADCFAAALAITTKGAVLLTGDKEFKSVESEVAITWLA